MTYLQGLIILQVILKNFSYYVTKYSSHCVSITKNSLLEPCTSLPLSHTLTCTIQFLPKMVKMSSVTLSCWCSCDIVSAKCFTIIRGPWHDVPSSNPFSSMSEIQHRIIRRVRVFYIWWRQRCAGTSGSFHMFSLSFSRFIVNCNEVLANCKRRLTASYTFFKLPSNNCF